MSSRRAPRLGLLARLGFVASLAIAVLATVVMLDIRPRTDGAASANSGSRTARKSDTPPASGSDVTGSLSKPATAPAAGLGPVSGLPVPRFVSLKTDRVNVRQGPTRNQEVAFTFQRVGLPVEVIAEFENWRRIRDSEGAEGWVMQGLLSGRRTALVAPWSDDATLALYDSASATSRVIAKLEPGVLATIRSCSDDWCHITGDGFDGHMAQERLWGAYPGEAIE